MVAVAAGGCVSAGTRSTLHAASYAHRSSLSSLSPLSLFYTDVPHGCSSPSPTSPLCCALDVLPCRSAGCGGPALHVGPQQLRTARTRSVLLCTVPRMSVPRVPTRVHVCVRTGHTDDFLVPQLVDPDRCAPPPAPLLLPHRFVASVYDAHTRTVSTYAAPLGPWHMLTCCADVRAWCAQLRRGAGGARERGRAARGRHYAQRAGIHVGRCRHGRPGPPLRHRRRVLAAAPRAVAAEPAPAQAPPAQPRPGARSAARPPTRPPALIKPSHLAPACCAMVSRRPKAPRVAPTTERCV